MTMTMSLRYKNPDSSADINSRLQATSLKGFVSGGDIAPVPGLLEVEVTPFVCVTYEGAVVRSDGNIRVGGPARELTPGFVNYIVLRAQYVQFGSPIMQVEPVIDTMYPSPGSPEEQTFHIIGAITIPEGATSIADSDISYFHAPATPPAVGLLNRHAIDPQARSSYKEPVATAADLPNGDGNKNAHGDVRLVMDTGSFKWWDATIAPAGDWRLFDEVSIQTHRIHEHNGGVTGDSAENTLKVVGVDIAEVGVTPPAPGSGYTVAGQYRNNLTGPTNVVLSPFAKGLVQIYVDSAGTVQASHRMEAVTATINGIEIVDISDNHPTAAVSFALTSSVSGAGRNLSWEAGEPVFVPAVGDGTKHRLYDPSATFWVDVLMVSGVAVSTGSSSYKVYDAKDPVEQSEENLLLAYVWLGSSSPDMGTITDKRQFGNTGVRELATSLKDVTLVKPWNDIRGNMVFSGGDVTQKSSPAKTIEVTGPVVSYIRGKRYESPVKVGSSTGFGGITLGNATHRLFINDKGEFTIASAFPAGDHARIATVVVQNPAPQVTITDEREPQVVVGNATKRARLFWTAEDSLEWNPATATLSVLDNGSGSGTKLTVETVNSETVNAELLAGSGCNLNLDTGEYNGDLNIATGDLRVGGSVDVDGGDLDVSGSATVVGPVQAESFRARDATGVGLFTNPAGKVRIVATNNPSSIAHDVDITASSPAFGTGAGGDINLNPGSGTLNDGKVNINGAAVATESIKSPVFLFSSVKNGIINVPLSPSAVSVDSASPPRWNYEPLYGTTQAGPSIGYSFSGASGPAALQIINFAIPYMPRTAEVTGVDIEAEYFYPGVPPFTGNPGNAAVSVRLMNGGSLLATALSDPLGGSASGPGSNDVSLSIPLSHTYSSASSSNIWIGISGSNTFGYFRFKSINIKYQYSELT